MVQIKQQLVVGSTKLYAGTNRRTHITEHMTGNTNIGADAQAHANLQSRGNVRNASWQWTVDDKIAIQSFPNTARCWHAGDGDGDGNMNSIAIEICVNRDGNLAQAIRNAAELTAFLMEEEDVALGNVVQHNFWSGKNCPSQLRAGIPYNWSQFLGFASSEILLPPAPKPANKPTGGSIMSGLPTINFNTTSSQWNPMVERVQALVKYAADVDPGPIDGRNGALTKRGVAAMQVKYNCGDGKGGADLIVGDKSWASLLLGTRY